MIEKVIPKPSLLSRLRRETSSGSYMPELDGLRFLAVASVFYFHVGVMMRQRATAAYVQTMPHDYLAQILQVGERGVSLFFVISGFILGIPFAQQHLKGGKRIRLQDFYLRRLTRLEPPFIVCLVLCLGLALARFHRDIGFVFRHFLANLTYTHTLVFHSLSPINAVLWSLEVEAQFYLLMPIFATIYMVRRAMQRRALLLTIVVGVMLIYPLIFAPGNTWGRYTAPFSLPCFLLGMLLADLYLDYWKNKPPSSNACDIIALICVVIMFTVHESVNADRLLIPWIVGLLAASVLCGKASKRLASVPVLCTIGGMCYSIYLFHGLLILLIGAITLRLVISSQFLPNFVLQSLVMTPVILSLCTLYFLLVEKPCMARDWPQKMKAKFTKSSLITEEPV